MSATTRRLGLTMLLASVCVATPADAAPVPLRGLQQRMQRTGRWLRKLPRTFDRTGVVATLEAQVGVGLNAVGDLGFRMTVKDAQTGRRRTNSFVSGEVHAFAVGVRGSMAADPTLRGIEKKIGPIGHGSPMYGDRLSIVVIPEVLSVFAGRSGGLGFRLNLFPLFTGPLGYLARWGGSIYVTDPRLAPAANWVLDKSDRLEAKLKQRIFVPVKNVWQRLHARFAAAVTEPDVSADTADTPPPGP